jgi:hypothetical protein
VKARQEAGGRRQEENNYSIKTGFSITPSTGLGEFLERLKK